MDEFSSYAVATTSSSEISFIAAGFDSEYDESRFEGSTYAQYEVVAGGDSGFDTDLSYATFGNEDEDYTPGSGSTTQCPSSDSDSDGASSGGLVEDFLSVLPVRPDLWPNEYEWMRYCQWLQMIHAATREIREITEVPEHERVVTSRMAIFLFFFRLGIAIEEIIERNFDSRAGWNRRRRQPRQDHAVRWLIVPLFSPNLFSTETSVVWWCRPRIPLVAVNKLKMQMYSRTKLCHIRDTESRTALKRHDSEAFSTVKSFGNMLKTAFLPSKKSSQQPQPQLVASPSPPPPQPPQDDHLHQQQQQQQLQLQLQLQFHQQQQQQQQHPQQLSVAFYHTSPKFVDATEMSLHFANHTSPRSRAPPSLAGAHAEDEEEFDGMSQEDRTNTLCSSDDEDGDDAGGFGSEEAPQPLSFVHVRQSKNWDCGIACVEMVLKTLQVPSENGRRLRRLAGTKSIWTIHLAYLLRHFSVPATFCTTTIGVDASHYSNHFYTKNGTLDHETVVVNRMFAQAAANNVTVQQATTQLHDIARVLVEGNLVILLVDSRTLRCSECKKGKSFGGGFVGHYIVLCGYQPHDLSFVYMDPARDHEMCRIGAQELELARNRKETDLDTLIVWTRAHA